jgi:hypothetical protein
MVVGCQPGQIVCGTLSRKKNPKNRPDGVAQDIGPELKPQYCQKKKTKEKVVHLIYDHIYIYTFIQ